MNISNKCYIIIMETMYDLVYAKVLSSHYGNAIKSACYGCEMAFASQYQHSCMVLPDEDHIIIVFEHLMDIVNILSAWSHCLDEFNITSALQALHYRKLSCKNWCAAMKTDSWRERMQHMVLTWLKVGKLI